MCVSLFMLCFELSPAERLVFHHTQSHSYAVSLLTLKRADGESNHQPSEQEMTLISFEIGRNLFHVLENAVLSVTL